MKTAKLIIDGKEIEVQLSDEQVEELTTPKKVTGFERAKVGERYELVTMFGDINFNYEEESGNDNAFYITANYYTDKELAEWCNRSDTLTRRMRRWAAEYNPSSFDWSNPDTHGCYIYFSRGSLDIYYFCGDQLHELVYFATEEIAKEAIKVFGDEIKWLAENRPKWF